MKKLVLFIFGLLFILSHTLGQNTNENRSEKSIKKLSPINSTLTKQTAPSVKKTNESDIIDFRPDHKSKFDNFDLKDLIGYWLSLDGKSFFKISQKGNETILEGDYFPNICKKGDKATLELTEYQGAFYLSLKYTLGERNGTASSTIPIKYSLTNDLLLIGKETPHFSEGGGISTPWAYREGIKGKEFKRMK
ncbi:MAG: hypothetical protein HQ541_04100 [Mariniphaga sp.]|nr:hypothetical protein [Mariniphaga sp.]